MIKRGHVTPVLVVAIFLVLLASTQVSAQQFPLPFHDFISAMMESGFFAFIFFFGLFFVLGIASLSRIFPKNYATLIALFVSLLMTTSAYYYGYLDRIMQEFAGPIAFWLFLLLIALLFFFMFIMRKERPPSYKVVLLLLSGLGILALVILRKDNVAWNYLSWAVIGLGIVTLIVFGINLIGLIRAGGAGGAGGGGRGGGDDRRGTGEEGEKKRGWLGKILRWPFRLIRDGAKEIAERWKKRNEKKRGEEEGNRGRGGRRREPGEERGEGTNVLILNAPTIRVNQNVIFNIRNIRQIMQVINARLS